MFKSTSRNRWPYLACLVVIALWYPLLTCLLGFPPSRKLDFGLAFNSMAEHLLAGRFDVDPAAIDAEGFEVNGRTVAYFGIFCALLRIPLVLLPGFARTDVTWWSCLIAMWTGAALQIRTIAQMWTEGSPPRQVWLAAALSFSVVLGGQHIQFLRPSIYQEPINWAFCQAMGFIWLTIRGFTTARGFDRRTLCGMAACAGLALLTRVSFGIGLYAAFGLFLLARANKLSDIRTWLAPAAILLAGMIFTGIVNEGRWGSPFIFADYSKYNLSQDVYPDRLVRLAIYGTFNPERIWLGLGYYFLPVWAWIRSDGHVLFAETQARLMDAMELPPGSFFLTDPLLLGLAAAGIFAIRDRVRGALLLGLCAPPLLMLCAISMAHRYRMEFYPLLFLAALFGVASMSRPTPASPRFRAGIIAITAIGIVASHATAIIYAQSPPGPGEYYLERDGLVEMYARPSH